MNSQRFFKSAKSLVRDPDKEPVSAYLDDECGHVQRLGMESRLQPVGIVPCRRLINARSSETASDRLTPGPIPRRIRSLPMKYGVKTSTARNALARKFGAEQPLPPNRLKFQSLVPIFIWAIECRIPRKNRL